MKDYIVIEYSPSQKCFHRHHMSTMIQVNHRTIFSGRNPGYIPVAVLESQKEADEWLEENRLKFENIEPS